MKRSVVFKGTRDGLHLVINANENIDDIKVMLNDKLHDAKKFYVGANVVLEFKEEGSVLSNELKEEVIALLKDNGMSVKLADVGLIEKMREERARFQTVRAAQNVAIDMPAPIIRGLEREYLPMTADTIMVKRTLRAGQCVSFDGNIVVMGDVNLGAEVEATCDIVILGSLRGIAHAGMTGNKDAKVMALRLMASQLRIANKITRAPDGAVEVPKGPEIASIKENSIVIEPWTSHSGAVFE